MPARKRPHEGGGGRAAAAAAAESRKRRKGPKQQKYHSDSEEDQKGGDDFPPVNLLESDEEDIHNAVVGDDGASSGSEEEGDTSSEADGSSNMVKDKPPRKQKPAPREDIKKRGGIFAGAEDDPAGYSEDDSAEDSEDPPKDTEGPAEVSKDASDADESSEDSDGDFSRATQKAKSERNDPSSFATSMSRIIDSKLSTSRRADPVLARSAAAAEAARSMVDSTLELRARRQMREHRRLAREKGRVCDVLTGKAATGAPPATAVEDAGEDGVSVARVLEAERRLRKVAQRGVVKLFNAVRAAQVASAEAERAARRDGVLGVDRKQRKVQEMTKKGFLELIASGGGSLKKGALEEA